MIFSLGPFFAASCCCAAGGTGAGARAGAAAAALFSASAALDCVESVGSAGSHKQILNKAFLEHLDTP